MKPTLHNPGIPTPTQDAFLAENNINREWFKNLNYKAKQPKQAARARKWWRAVRGIALAALTCGLCFGGCAIVGHNDEQQAIGQPKGDGPQLTYDDLPVLECGK